MKKAATLLLTGLLTMALTIPAFANNFTPSVEQKEAPSVVTVKDENGNDVSAVIKDAQGNEVAGVSGVDLVVTPTSKAGSASPEIQEMIEQAYQQIQSADNLAVLTPDLAAYLEETSDDVKTTDLVVRDLFDVSLMGENASLLSQAGNNITITFQLKLDQDALLVVLHNYEGDKWEVIPSDRVVRSANGDVSVTFDSLSPVAFLVDSGEVVVDPSGPDSPQTGVSFPALPVAGAILFGLAAVAVLAMGRKKSA